MKKYFILILFLLILLPNNLTGAGCYCYTEIGGLCSSDCCNSGAMCHILDNCDCGFCGCSYGCIDNIMEDLCGTKVKYCEQGLNCYFVSQEQSCPDYEHTNYGTFCHICYQEQISRYQTENGTCWYNCGLDCTINGWERFCFSDSTCNLGECCKCTDVGCSNDVPSQKIPCDKGYSGFKIKDCQPPGSPRGCDWSSDWDTSGCSCNLNLNGDFTIDYECILNNENHIEDGNLTIVTGGSIQMQANSTLQFDSGHSIIIQGGQILKSQTNTRIIKI